MVFRRVAASALGQAALFGCGAGALAAASARLYAAAAVMTLMAVWIAAAAAWQGRLRPHTSSERPPTPRQRDHLEQRLLTTLLDQTPAPLLTRDAQGVLQARNRAARSLFRTDDRVTNPPPALLEALEDGSGLERLSLPGADPQEADRAYALALGDVLSAAGPMRLAVLLDIEPELRAAEAAALREVLQVLSHEIMNGLTPIASLAETAQELLEGGEDARAQALEALEVIARRAGNLARFADGYRTLARLPAPVRAHALLSDLLDEAGRLFRSQWPDVELKVMIPTADIDLMIDRGQVTQALANIMTNAAQAALVSAEFPRVQIESFPAGVKGVTIRVSDNGPGVSDLVRDHIGKPFFTTKKDGTGVGLSLARQVARAHGGSLELRQRPSTSGAVFDIHLSL